ncbi:MAG: glycoside hydrolase family 15 protein [Chloroflexota bacterium]
MTSQRGVRLALAGLGLALAALAWGLWLSRTPAPPPAAPTLFASKESPTRQGGPAPGTPTLGDTWTTGAKMGIGTAYTYDFPPPDNPSKVWFTVGGGNLTEVMYPTVDMANLKEMKYLVTDGASFLWDETRDADHQVTLLDKRALAYQVTSTDKQGRFQITKRFAANARANAVAVQTTFQQMIPGRYQLFLYLVPHVRNSGSQDRGRFIDLDGGKAALAWDRDVYMVAATTTPWLAYSVGHVRDNDGYSDLKSDFRLDWQFDEARGRVAFVMEIAPENPWTTAIGFGDSETAARQAVAQSLDRGFEEIWREYVAGWHRYTDSLENLGGKATDLYYQSAMVIKAHQDKTYRGAIVASLALPWGYSVLDEEENRGYRYVWARDLYHAAMGLLAVGDRGTVDQVLEYLDDVQQLPSGAFPQNTYVDGKPYWGSLQMDEVADPLILAWWAKARGRYLSLVKPAADFLWANGPATKQERWEENGGYSPATIAAEIAGLVCAADLAKEAGDAPAAQKYLAKADEWQRAVERWTFTTRGLIGDGRYYLRVAPTGQPDLALQLHLSNAGGAHDQKSIVDPSFLELVRLGVRSPLDSHITASIPATDLMTMVRTPVGPGWHRYNFDGYGEAKPGAGVPGKGHLWTLLTGERGMYELAAGREARPYLEALERFANAGGMIPEQVWEETGQGTASATPLVWSHAEYLVLLRSVVTGVTFDRPEAVYQRYNK